VSCVRCPPLRSGTDYPLAHITPLHTDLGQFRKRAPLTIGRLVGACLGITAALGFGVTAAGLPQEQAALPPVGSVCPNASYLSDGEQCTIEFILDATGRLNMLGNSMSPYEGSDDILIGVINEDPNFSITDAALSGPALPNAPLLGFDSDGICTFAPGNPFGDTAATPSGILSYCDGSQIDGLDPYDDMGPDQSGPLGVSNISAHEGSGQANFTTPLVPGDSTFFDLETASTSGEGITGTMNPSSQARKSRVLVLLGF